MQVNAGRPPPFATSASMTLRKKRICVKLLTQILLKFTRLSAPLFSALICAECGSHTGEVFFIVWSVSPQVMLS